MEWFRRQPRGRHAAGRAGAEAAVVEHVAIAHTPSPVVHTDAIAAPAGEPMGEPGGVNLVFDDGTVVRLPEGDPRGLAFRLVADALVRGR